MNFHDTTLELQPLEDGFGDAADHPHDGAPEEGDVDDVAFSAGQGFVDAGPGFFG